MAQIESALPQVRASVGDAVKNLGRLRLVTGSLLLVISLVGLLGADWDIQWHAVIGRDRTFTPPHDMILIGIGAAGIVALLSIVLETTQVRRYPELLPFSTDFLGILHSSLGLYLVGFGAVCSAVAFPLDTYWHSLYGIDVSLWAPFHTMIYMGGVLSSIGIIYLLLSAAHLAEQGNDRHTALLSYAAMLFALGVLLSKMSTFLTPALSGHNIRLGFLTVNLFPFLLAFVAALICILAVKLVHWIGAATLAVIVLLLLWLLVSVFVPPMMTTLVRAEHETYLARASKIGSTIVPLLGQTPALLLASLSIDGVVWLGRLNRWEKAKQQTWVLVAALISLFLVALITLISIRIGGTRLTRGAGIGLLISLLLTVPGCLLGNWLASALSGTLQELRR
jgi:hypothetical protein